MSLQLDLVDQATIRHDANGIEAVRRGLLREIGGAPINRPRTALYLSGMPRYGDVYPPIPSLRVVDIRLVPLDVETWSVTVVYREPGAGELAHALPVGSVVDVQWFSSNVTVDRLFDAAGRRMFHYYIGYPEQLIITGWNARIGRTLTPRLGIKSERADVQIPSVGARVTMTEASDPRSRLGFIGKVNSDYWSNSAPQTWIMAGLSGAKERERWINTYELIYRADTWRLNSVVEFNGAPPSDATEGNGIQNFEVYSQANFAGLGFSL